jgi:aldose 1-epimerase
MSIRRDPFGSAGGQEIDLYTLRSAGGLEARIATYGATLVSLAVPDAQGAASDILLGFDTLEGYVQDPSYFGGTIGRFANRIADGTFCLDGRRHDLPRNDGRHHLHGGSRGFHKVVWEARAEETSGGPAVTLSYTSPAGEAGYPGTLRVQVGYTLAGNALRIDYTATTDAPTVVNLTNHAYFNLAGQGTVCDHVLRIGASRFLPVSDARIPLGEMKSVSGTAFDFRDPVRIGDRLLLDDAQLRISGGYDHCWILDPPLSLETEAAELYEPLSGRVMKVFTTQPGLQFYSGNFLDGSVQGKGGIRYPRHGAVCLETQHFPDSPNQPAFPTTRLDPDGRYEQTTVYRFATRADRGG